MKDRRGLALSHHGVNAVAFDEIKDEFAVLATSDDFTSCRGLSARWGRLLGRELSLFGFRLFIQGLDQRLVDGQLDLR